MSNYPIQRQKRGRRSLLEDTPGLIDLVAELYASGMTHREMMEHLPITDRGALGRWLKDPRVQVATQKIMQERSIRIRRKVDGELEARVSDTNRLRQMPPETLLKIRKDLSSDFIEGTTGPEMHQTISDLWLLAATDPEAARILNKLNLMQDGDVKEIAAAVEEVEDAEVVDDRDPDDERPADAEEFDAEKARDEAEDRAKEKPEDDYNGGIEL